MNTAALAPHGTHDDPGLAATLAPDRSPVRIAGGTLAFADRYRLRERLGEGGMGVVWEAEDLVLLRRVAIKILHAAPGDAVAVAQLRREAQVLAQVDHPNVVGVLDVGVLDDGRPFLVMERVRGQPLSAVLEAHGALPWPEALALAVQIVDGLARAHDVGIIHRDLKPSNVLVVRDAQGRAHAKLIDFGLAKGATIADDPQLRTRTGEISGTPASMAPEQVRGERVDARADLYAFGVLLFELLAGRRPFVHATAIEVLYAHLYEAAPPVGALVRGLPDALEAIVARCLQKSPDARFEGVHALRRALLDVGTAGDSIASPAAPICSDVAVAIRPPAERGRVRWLVGVLVVGTIAGVTAWVGGRASPTSQATPAGPPEFAATLPADTLPAETSAATLPAAAPPTDTLPALATPLAAGPRDPPSPTLAVSATARRTPAASPAPRTTEGNRRRRGRGR